jgi:hypothetical protein
MWCLAYDIKTKNTIIFPEWQGGLRSLSLRQLLENTDYLSGF